MIIILMDLKTVLDSIDEAVLLTDKKGQVIDANKNVKNIFGLSKKEIIGKKYTVLGIKKRGGIQKFKEKIAKIKVKKIVTAF